MGIIAWIFIGLIAGWLAKEILGVPGGIFYNLAVGLVGTIIFLAVWRAIRRA